MTKKQITNNKFPIFKNAPITEALLDIQVTPRSDITIQQLENLYNNIKKKYSDKKKRIEIKGSFKFNKKGFPIVPPASIKPVGYFFKSPKENKIVQARINGFTFNKLKPYQNWELFFCEAKKLWSLYKKIAEPQNIIRIALRYINQIEIPLPITDLDDYIKTIQPIPSLLPQKIKDYFSRITIPFDEINAEAILTQTIKGIKDNEFLIYIFDIDVYQNKIYNINDKNFWKIFEKLRTYKNKIFFKSLTNKAKELFK